MVVVVVTVVVELLLPAEPEKRNRDAVLHLLLRAATGAQQVVVLVKFCC